MSVSKNNAKRQIDYHVKQNIAQHYSFPKGGVEHLKAAPSLAGADQVFRRLFFYIFYLFILFCYK